MSEGIEKRSLKRSGSSGLLVGLGVVMVGAAIMFLGGSAQHLLAPSRLPHALPFDDGLIPGAKVVLGGILIGTVDTVKFDPKARDVVVTARVYDEHRD